VIHSPHLYSRVNILKISIISNFTVETLNIYSLLDEHQAEAVNGLGWNSRTFQPIQCRLMQTVAEDQQNFKIQELEKELADKNKEVSYWKMTAKSSRENHLRLISDLNRFEFH
jgi:hypothetical protein